MILKNKLTLITVCTPNMHHNVILLWFTGDKDLMLNLIYDADITKGIFTESKNDTEKKKK